LQFQPAGDSLLRACAWSVFMQVDEIEHPFNSIESAQEFVDVLADTVLDAVKELNQQYQEAVGAGLDRRAQAINLALLKLKTLNCSVFKCRRMLNDLRILRRLILDERATVERVMAAM
jgi:hypothetical protein